jgi:flagellar basal body-associated protein FliL
MATYTPPPYFPQSSLAPADKNRYRKFKLIVFLVVVFLLLILAGVGWGAWHLIKAAF